ncbi:MAG: phosphatase PAP2 family protein [candidate division KSB1 bacterium]|nr:phosphatase PAP2 family protein [candidate division KSB1 bacterium]MDZ7273590.1 phosphatase PAP2 family protein [candidate division KSB1 bacterium]MDZ7286819.1 phosphatase PAP2 family protein [candidate division KSB1 bacterium]MDZ7299824.1 phosphatase PAP2 family protein [candidate division KSB1 bacterium]MDZ7308451.1 phosphatase PAP2 family protein [candidate division KSB1 bacterium]
MLEQLLQIDIALFFFVNHTLQCGVLDWLMPIVTNPRNWFPLFAAVYVWLWWKGGPTGRSAALLIIPVILLSDQIAAFVLKPWFQRLRPCVVLEGVHMILGKSTSFSFPSNHAANSFAAAALFTHFYPQQRTPLYACAFLSGFSRIYLGLHYPSDVAGGALFGMTCAWLVLKAHQFARQHCVPGRPQPAAEQPSQKQ